MAWTSDEFDGTLGLWGWINQGDASAAVADGQLVITAPSKGSDQLRFLYQSYTGTLKVTAPISGLTASWSNYQGFGIAVRDSASGKFLVFVFAMSAGPKLRIMRFSSATAYDSDRIGAGLTQMTDMGGYLQIEDDGTDLILRLSRFGSHGDGGALTFIEIYREAKSAWLTAADQIGFVVDPLNSDTVLLARWARTDASPADDEVVVP